MYVYLLYVCLYVCCVMQEQYIFLYNAVREFLLCGDTSVRAVDLRKNISRMEAEEREGYRKQLEVCTYVHIGGMYVHIVCMSE